MVKQASRRKRKKGRRERGINKIHLLEPYSACQQSVAFCRHRWNVPRNEPAAKQKKLSSKSKNIDKMERERRVVKRERGREGRRGTVCIVRDSVLANCSGD